MFDSDKKDFKELFDGIAEYYRQDKLGKIALQVYFGALKNYTIEQVSQAASQHLIDTKSGQYFPKAADLIKHLEGVEISADDIIAAAKLAVTPLGCICRIHIGSWDLNSQDGFYLRQRATECIQLLPTWKERALRGEYTDHEISIMLKYNVNPAAQFYVGMAAPDNAKYLLDRADKISKSSRHAFLLEAPYQPSEDDKTAVIHGSILAAIN